MTTDATREHCLDAETLAAWADRGLPAADAERVERHLSNCERCQEVLAALVRSQPSPAVVIPFWSRPAVRLGAAGLAVAASLALVVWTTRPPTVTEADSIVASRELAAPTPAPVATPPAAAPTDAPVPPRRSAPASRPSPLPPSVTAAPAPAAQAPPVVLPPAPPPVAQAAPPPPVHVTAASPPGAGMARTTSISAARQTAVVADVMAERTKAELAAIEIVAPDPRANAGALAPRGGVAGGRGGGVMVPTRWRILGGTSVQRSVDGGATWWGAILPATSSFTLTAGSAATQTVCWLVGRDGAVFVTRDGLTFARVPFPDSGHLRSVQAIDALHALVTTQDGRTFSTSDAGVTWVAR